MEPTSHSGPKVRTEVDREAVQAALLRHGGNVTQTAEELGVARNTLYRWLKKWGLELNQVRD